MQIIDNIICFGNLDDRSILNTISSSIGSCEGEIDENLLNVVTALSGSGPAYVSEANNFSSDDLFFESICSSP
jgi:pyrroline-5-carboxylate reductase